MPLSVTYKKEAQPLYLVAIVDSRSPIFTAYPAALSSDEHHFAVERLDGFVELYYLTHNARFESLTYMLTLKIPNGSLTSHKLAFSADNHWLLVKDATETDYICLPMSYLTGQLSLEQITFICILHESLSSRNFNRPVYFDIALAHYLVGCGVF